MVLLLKALFCDPTVSAKASTIETYLSRKTSITIPQSVMKMYNTLQYNIHEHIYIKLVLCPLHNSDQKLAIGSVEL